MDLVVEISHAYKHLSVVGTECDSIRAIDRAPNLLEVDRPGFTLTKLGDEPQGVLVKYSTENIHALLICQRPEEVMGLPTTLSLSGVGLPLDLVDGTVQPTQREFGMELVA